MKYSFRSDYREIAHPQVLQALSAIGDAQFDGYGLDEFSVQAGEMVRAKVSAPSAGVHFVSGGTLANLTVISSALRPFESVIAAESGHIFMHETGAIEATGHKVCTAKGENGKLRVVDIESIVSLHSDEHMVKPRLVYISQSAETGSVYTKAELTVISECCRKNSLYLFLDGARLGAAINSPACDLTYADVAALTDVFYIGGTKNGALFGEAIVICADELKEDFRYHMKQKGALLAKGAVISVQFDALFRGGLYDELAGHANKMALRMADGIKTAGYGFLYPVETNLIVPVLPCKAVSGLRGLYGFYDLEVFEDMAAIRIVTSWATSESIVDEFLSDLAALL